MQLSGLVKNGKNMNSTPTLEEALKSVEIAFKASKPHIQLKDAIVLYKAIIGLNIKNRKLCRAVVFHALKNKKFDELNCEEKS